MIQVPEMIGQARTTVSPLPRQRGPALAVFLFLLLGTATVSSALSLPEISIPNFLPADGWGNAHATFYGDETASETMGGACGYGNLFATGYGTATAALSTMLYLEGFSCGRCFEVRCSGSAYCNPGSPTITVTATNLCPPNLALPTNNGGWCNPPRFHFDMSKPAFMKIAYWRAGIVPVMYRRVACSRRGGVRFLLQGNGYWLLAFVMNVGGSGDVGSLWVKGSKTDWIKMSHSWGASFQAFSRLAGQSLSFKVVSYTTGQTILANNVAPTNWWAGMTYQAQVNFT